jgi:hypothetical protein
MKLEEIASKEPFQRSLLSALVVITASYKKDVADGLPFFSEEELSKIEANPNYKESGLTFQQIKEILASKGLILKPATFKKYLALGLIPGTTNIKRTGKGNIGFYPVSIIRDINLIKYTLYANLSFDDLLSSSINSYSMDLSEFIERLNPEALSPLIDWEADWDVQETVERELSRLFDDGQISRKEMDAAKRKAAAYGKASSQHFKAQRGLRECLEGIKVNGAYLLKELLQREGSSTEEENLQEDN